jgi:hypothetical protein
LDEVAKRLKEEGIRDPIPLLKHLGFTVKWRGLDSAVVVKEDSKMM